MNVSCANCAHWKQGRYDWETQQYQPLDPHYDGYGVCGAITQYGDYKEDDPPTDQAIIAMIDDPYVAADFRTRPDFSCSLYEERKQA